MEGEIETTENTETTEKDNQAKVEEIEGGEEVVAEEAEEEVIPDKPEELEIETREKRDERIDYGEDIDPDDVKTVGAIVEKQTAPLKKALQEQQDMAEIGEFVGDHPEYAKYKRTIFKYLQHPAYINIPVKNIAAMVASGDLIRLGAEKEREAQSKADATRSGGDVVRKSGGGETDWSRASIADFEAQKRIILGQKV